MAQLEPDKKWLNKLPILWKRKINNIIKKNRQNALEFFFIQYLKPFSLDQKRSQYALVQLLPESLEKILTEIENFSSEELMLIIDLFINSKFLNGIKALEKKKQIIILNKFYETWPSIKMKGEYLQKILFNINPDLSNYLYEKINERAKPPNDMILLEIISLWGDPILPNILNLYLDNPKEVLKPLFTNLSSIKRIQLLSKLNQNDITLERRFINLFPLLKTSEEEINFLLSLIPSLDQKSIKSVIKWQSKKIISHDILIKKYQIEKDKTIQEFIIQYFIYGLQKELYTLKDVILYLLDLNAFSFGYQLFSICLQKIEVVEPIISVLKILTNKALQHSDFFQQSLEKYGEYNLELILETFLDNSYESFQKLILPSLQINANKNFQLFLKKIVENKSYTSYELVRDIFTKCNSDIKIEIGKFIINSSWIPQLSFLFTYYSIFKVTLISKRKLTITEQSLIDPFIYQHLFKQTEDILSLTDKITYPKLAFAVIADKTLLIQILKTIDRMKNKASLINFWQEIFVYCPDDSFSIVLEEYRSQILQEKEYLIPLIQKLIELKLNQFWKYMENIPKNEIPKYEQILTYAFEKDLLSASVILSKLPNTHLEFIYSIILPKLKNKGKDILYALLSVDDPINIDFKVIEQTVLRIVNTNQKEFLPVVLIRCSNLIQKTPFSSFSNNLVMILLSQYSTESFEIIDQNNLTSLVKVTNEYLGTLDANKLFPIMQKIIPTLASDILTKVIVDKLYNLIKNYKRDLKLLAILFEDFENSVHDNKYSLHAKNVLKELTKNLIGISSSFDLFIFPFLENKPYSQELIAPVYFSQIDQKTLEKIIFDPSIPLDEKNLIEALIKRLEDQPQKQNEQYIINLYNNVTKEKLKENLLIILAKYLSWPNLPILINLSEINKYPETYNKALTIFANRFDIQSSNALIKIWEAGLQKVYDQKERREGISHSNCPQCNNPILENQKSCGFCTQGLTCVICMASVVSIEERDIVKCPQCGNYFHRTHLLTTIKLQNKCPICFTKMNESTVNQLSKVRFFFH